MNWLWVEGGGVGRFVELGRFALVSLVGTVVDFLVLWLLVAQAGWGPVPAKIVAVEAAIVNTFVWNNAWTFRGRDVAASLPRRFLAFNVASAGSFVLGLVTIALLVALFGPRYYLLYNVATLPLNFVWNYLWSARVIWRGSTAVLDAEHHSNGDTTAASRITDHLSP